MLEDKKHLGMRATQKRTKQLRSSLHINSLNLEMTNDMTLANLIQRLEINR